MGDGFQFFDIILFAAIAGFLLFRLRSVLGRRTGNEQRRPDPFAPAPPKPVLTPVPPPAADAGRAPAAPIAGGTGPAALKAADPSFDEKVFLQGARGAFEIVVNSFAAGDTSVLQPLLSKDVFAAFSESIRARAAAKEALQTTLLSIKSAELVEVSVEGGTAIVAVKFVSDQINVTRSADGKVVDGDPDKVIEKTDFWTFARPIRSRDPNWTLVATHTPE
jgi:predicted lipid-binding transport protein (Tim44 family)